MAFSERLTRWRWKLPDVKAGLAAGGCVMVVGVLFGAAAIAYERKEEVNIVKLLGATQLLVFGAAMAGGLLLRSVIGSGGMSDILVNVGENQSRMRISNIVKRFS